MAATRDVIGFTRIFVLFCTLVLLPALMMSGFAVVAIVNERQAEKTRRREAAEDALVAAEKVLLGLLDQTDRDLRARMESSSEPVAMRLGAARATGLPIGAWIVLDEAGNVLDATLELPGASADRIVDLARSARPGRNVHVAVDEPELSAVLSVQRVMDGRVVVYALDTERLRQAVRGASKEFIAIDLRVSEQKDEPIVDALSRLMGELVDDKKAPVPEGGQTEELLTRRLESPFDRYTLVASALPSAALFWTTFIYIALLVVFLATLITGVVITARLIYQEAKLSRLKTDFVSHMSHELRTPLTSIRMFIETLKMGRAGSKEEEQECLELLAKETERLSEMIERVLGYARLRAGRRLFAPQAVPVKDLVDDATDAFRAQVLGRQAQEDKSGGTPKLTLSTQLEPGLPLVHADREAVVEALLNLLGNAYKYGGADKEIMLFGRMGRRGHVAIGVKDNGPGLPRAEHQRVFERFYQAGNLLSQQQKGSGLGLAITKAIIDGQGGKIGVESEPGKGATFVIELKVEEPSRAAG